MPLHKLRTLKKIRHPEQGEVLRRAVNFQQNHYCPPQERAVGEGPRRIERVVQVAGRAIDSTGMPVA